MSVQVMQQGGGGLWDSIFPRILGLAGTAVGGPLGGMAGNFAGNMIGGQDAGSSAINTGSQAVPMLWDQESPWQMDYSSWRNGGWRR